MEAVQRGVALLDEKVPRWERKIDLEKLLLSSNRYCILGQLFGGFAKAVKKMNIDYKFGCIYYGFEVSRGGSYYNLRTEWEKIIKERIALA